MPNPNYQRGRRFEWQLKKDLEKQGWVVTRASGSHGIFDLVGLRETENGGQVALIQCKVIKDEKQTPRLIKEFAKKAPFRHDTFSQLLAIKVTGKSYILYKHCGGATDE